MRSKAPILALAQIVLGCSSSFADPTEYQVKAAYVYNFVKFTEWAKSDSFTHLAICIYGKDPFEGSLEEVVRGKLVHNVPVVVTHPSIEEITGDRCQVLFFGSANTAQIESGLRRVQGQGIITIGESDSFIEKGGMIGLVVEHGRVRFDINLAAIAAAHLELSSHVVALGRTVKSKTGLLESRK